MLHPLLRFSVCMTGSSCPACHQYFITDITGGPRENPQTPSYRNIRFNRIDSLLDRSVARCCLRQQVFPTILAQACHKTLTSWLCRLLGGGYSLYNSWTPPPLRKNSPNAETRMLNPGSRSGANLLHRKKYASRSCLIQLLPSRRSTAAALSICRSSVAAPKYEVV